MSLKEQIEAYLRLKELRDDALQEAYTLSIDHAKTKYIIRDVLGKQQKIQPCKVICVVEKAETAEELKAKIEAEIAEANRRRSELAEQCQAPVSRINFKVRIIKATGDITVSVSGAQRRKSITGEEAIAHIEHRIEQFKRNEQEKYAKETQELLSLIDKNEIYTIAAESGQSYRVSYYDPYKERRCQCSVGNILIAVGINTSILKNSPRKQRSDASKALGIYDDNHGLSLIYPFSSKYEKRRMARLDKYNDE